MGVLDVPGYSRAQADAKFTGTTDPRFSAATLQGSKVSAAIAPPLAKWPDNPILTQTASGAPSITWCWVLRVDDLPGKTFTARGRFYMWYSTDHDETDGGIWLAWSNDLINWTVVGLVYAGSNNQTETPSVIWDPTIAKFRMLYQAKSAGIGAQVTLASTSANGETGWSAAVITVDVANLTDQPGDGHGGYVRPNNVGSQLFAYSLYGGGDDPHQGILHSYDYGKTWMRDPRALGFGLEFTDASVPGSGHAGWRVDWLQNVVVLWRGQPTLIAGYRPKTSGGLVVETRWITAKLSPDFRRFASRAVDITPPAQAWENGILGSPLSAIAYQGQIYVFYRGGGHQGAFGVATIDLTQEN